MGQSKFQLSSNIYAEAIHLTSNTDYNMQTSKKVTTLFHLSANQDILSYEFFRALAERSPTIHIIYFHIPSSTFE